MKQVEGAATAMDLLSRAAGIWRQAAAFKRGLAGGTLVRLFVSCLAAAGFAIAAFGVSPTSAAETAAVEIPFDGLTLTGDLVRPDDVDTSQPIVLLVHGTFAHKDLELIEALQAALAEREVASLAVTLSLGQDRRVGMWDCNQPSTHRHEDAVAEISAWVDWLGDEGFGQIVPLGHSRGGAQVALWLSRQGERADIPAAVLIAPATEDGSAAESYEQRFGANLSNVLAEAKAAEPGQMLDVPGLVYCSNTTATAQSVLSYHAENPERDTPTLLTRGVSMPVLVIAASEDEVVTDLPERLAPIIDSAKIRLETVEGADHMFLDFFAEDAADLVAEHVTAIP
ncbi:alpha/beta hydrolase [Aurantimonas marina]|uniref:alpha/beta hydrolase n=1 Tax=Aurantimonas marina TaxID=2780508 RepID=UPI0019CF4FB5|nr:alpha/beta fold hydrolase [Aurantimonas marina]